MRRAAAMTISMCVCVCVCLKVCSIKMFGTKNNNDQLIIIRRKLNEITRTVSKYNIAYNDRANTSDM